jgi:hypothetical protein
MRDPVAYGFGRFHVLQFIKDRRWDEHAIEELWKQIGLMNQNQLVQRRRIGNDNHPGERLMSKRIAGAAIVLQVSRGVTQIHAMPLQERMDLHPRMVAEQSPQLGR